MLYIGSTNKKLVEPVCIPVMEMKFQEVRRTPTIEIIYCRQIRTEIGQTLPPYEQDR